MKDDISTICSDLEKTATDAHAAFGGLSATQLNWKPSEKEWSIAQCFEHLIVTNELYFPNIQKVIDGQHRNNLFSMIPFSTDLLAYAMKNSLDPNQTRKMKTFKIFEPSVSKVQDTIIDDFGANQRKLIELVKACDPLDVHRIKIAEPLSTALNLRLYDAFEILAMHCRRHFNQAKRVLEAPGFPA